MHCSRHPLQCMSSCFRRMLPAGDRLANSNDPISVISLSLGYESESALSTAFRRVMG
jgi:AraC-like DNA-binding protein